ncbi:MAG: hypothetical protein QNJ47_25310 [Nostocaceae cyanobacterium]|nr:hypothetical protein [Nostocaceae cyanobacterium]
MSVNDLIALCPLLLSIGGNAIAIVLWYVNSEKRKYGLERDFLHLKRNYEQINSNLLAILYELDNRFDRVKRDILEVKSNLSLSTKRKNEEY